MAALLADRALWEIRILAVHARRQAEEDSSAEAVEKINNWADFRHAMLGISKPHRWRPSRGTPSRREQVMLDRPMSYRWNVSSPERRAWIVRQIDSAGFRWTPPPPLPMPRKGAPALSMWQQLGLLRGWTVKTPPGRQRLPRQARILKALDREAIFALYEEAGRLRLGLGKDSPWLHAHLDSDAPHFLFPDPAHYYWPDSGAGRPWWQCSVLLRMVDGEQVGGSLAVMPETFTALPSTVPRLRQRRLALIARTTERDAWLWSRDHESYCGPDTCGYAPTDDPGVKP
ncbi:hypothetical protein [Streptomyces sp. XD-27]|uniref:hypothetical protein n=1 Tax=Streptomyces sp. XD-27 TaxID=3062779 RepID=UPI0026F47289|nr:hypothetical protein [Streptomyces sp. XD-27]WKX72536.1 hypothetical protein Q3Y56_23900 [Streptomyces sp. XD-27]